MNIQKSLLILGLCLSLTFCAATQKEPKIDKENDPQYIYEKAVVSMNYDLIDEAVKYLHQALDLNPLHFPSHYLLGVAYVKKENWIEARKFLEEAVNLKPNETDPHSYLISVYQNLGLMDAVIEEHKKIYALDKNFNSSFSLANYYFEKNELETALEYIRNAIIQNSQSTAAYNIYGVILSKLGRYPEAIMSFQNALRNDSNNVTAGINLGVAYINTQELDKARQILTKFLSITQDQALKKKIQEYLDRIKVPSKPEAIPPGLYY
ncbi:MAG: tetratricopeptide repeat protein [Candidatus Aminicenantes bacterium]|nr:tetratricopeptide repeat protein [Candidatus Aminicenantes bacterium]